MQDEAFEWDDEKAARNWRKHDVSFGMARDAFRDMFGVDYVDEAQHAAEFRMCRLGMVDDRVLFVSYTYRGARVRIISARLAERHERRRYHEENREA